MVRRTKEEAEQTRDAILDSALDVFYEKGFSRTTFDEIAKRINLTKGAVYWHFRNKVDLLAMLMKKKFSEKHQQTWEKYTPPQTLAELRKLLEMLARSTEADPAFCKFLFFIIFQMEWSEAVAARIAEKIREISDYPWFELKETLTLIQKSGEISTEVDIDELTNLISCMWRGVMNAFISKRRPFSLTTTVLAGFDLIMDGIKTEKHKCA